MAGGSSELIPLFSRFTRSPSAPRRFMFRLGQGWFMLANASEILYLYFTFITARGGLDRVFDLPDQLSAFIAAVTAGGDFCCNIMLISPTGEALEFTGLEFDDDGNLVLKEAASGAEIGQKVVWCSLDGFFRIARFILFRAVPWVIVSEMFVAGALADGVALLDLGGRNPLVYSGVLSTALLGFGYYQALSARDAIDAIRDFFFNPEEGSIITRLFQASRYLGLQAMVSSTLTWASRGVAFSYIFGQAVQQLFELDASSPPVLRVELITFFCAALANFLLRTPPICRERLAPYQKLTDGRKIFKEGGNEYVWKTEEVFSLFSLIEKPVALSGAVEQASLRSVEQLEAALGEGAKLVYDDDGEWYVYKRPGGEDALYILTAQGACGDRIAHLSATVVGRVHLLSKRQATTDCQFFFNLSTGQKLQCQQSRRLYQLTLPELVLVAPAQAKELEKVLKIAYDLESITSQNRAQHWRGLGLGDRIKTIFRAAPSAAIRAVWVAYLVSVYALDNIDFDVEHSNNFSQVLAGLVIAAAAATTFTLSFIPDLIHQLNLLIAAGSQATATSDSNKKAPAHHTASWFLTICNVLSQSARALQGVEFFGGTAAIQKRFGSVQNAEIIGAGVNVEVAAVNGRYFQEKLDAAVAGLIENLAWLKSKLGRLASCFSSTPGGEEDEEGDIFYECRSELPQPGILSQCWSTMTNCYRGGGVVAPASINRDETDAIDNPWAVVSKV